MYGERLLIGYRWYDRTGVEPLFPFGHGLGYTTFSISPAGWPGVGDGVTVDRRRRQHRRRAGGEVVQVYVEPLDGDPARPLRQLAGFARIVASTRRATEASRSGCRAAFEAVARRRLGPAGGVTILVGRSSRDLSGRARITAG